MFKKLTMLCAMAAIAVSAATVQAQLTVPSDGSDGLFLPTENTTVDLSTAATGVWSDPAPVPGQGVYDADKWAVVFKYAPQFGNQEFAVDIPAGVTITFTNHPSGAPVVWLVDGKVKIDGTINLDGSIGTGSNASFSIPGPGGFRGGHAALTGASAAAGLGPGGGNFVEGGAISGGGGYAFQGGGTAGSGGLPYGNARIIPLIGGSGGSGRNSTINDGGGAGGGAILIVASEEIIVNGIVVAKGNRATSSGGHASGGAIRLVSDRVSGSGQVQATGIVTGTSPGSVGRIRIEANVVTLTNSGTPNFTVGLPGDPPMVWPPSDAPRITPVTLAGVPIPTDPRASFDFPLSDVALSLAAPALLEIEATNLSTTSSMTVRIVPDHGDPMSVPAIFVSGDDLSSTWNAFCNLANGVSAIQIRAELP